jgi:hypothetical protein
MKKLKTIIMSGIVVGILFAQTSAHAVLTLRLQNGLDIVEVTGTDSFVNYNGVVGGWDINVSTGVGNTNPAFDILHLNSVNATTASSLAPTIAAGDLIIMLSQTGYTNTSSGFNGSLSASLGGTGQFETFIGASNIAFDTSAGPLFDSGMLGTGVHSLSDLGINDMTDPYSMTLKATLNHDGKQYFAISSFDHEITVPEPGSLALLGLGLLLLGIVKSRRTPLGNRYLV